MTLLVQREAGCRLISPPRRAQDRRAGRTGSTAGETHCRYASRHRRRGVGMSGRNGPRAVTGSQRVRRHRQRGINLSVLSCSWLLRARDGSRSDGRDKLRLVAPRSWMGTLKPERFTRNRTGEESKPNCSSRGNEAQISQMQLGEEIRASLPRLLQLTLTAQ